MSKYGIEILNISTGGFAPAWYKESYPVFGNKNQAGAMTNMDLTNPGYICQGPGLATLTDGAQDKAVTTLIKGMSGAIAADVAYGVGGAKLYKYSSTAVVNTGDFPHTIDKGTVTGEDGEDVCAYHGNLYYTYNHSGSAGDIGKFNLASTFDDDWGSTVPTGAANLQSGPHQMVVAGDVMFIANGRYIATWDDTDLVPQALDFPTGTVVQSIVTANDKLYISAINPSLTGTNKINGTVYIWDGADDVVEYQIPLMGNVGGLFVKNGTVFVFYQDLSSSGGYKLGYVNEGGITDVANFTGGLPSYNQITDFKDFILWNSAGSLWAFGSGDKDLPVRLHQLADGGYATVGGVSCPFGTILVASNETTSYKLAKFSGYDVNSSWKSLMFDITGDGQISKINTVRFNFETLATGARVDWKLLDNNGRTIYSDTISFAKMGAVTTAYYPLNGKVSENFRVELDYTNGSTTNTVKVKSIKIYGQYD
jgi:hypothetical protein